VLARLLRSLVGSGAAASDSALPAAPQRTQVTPFFALFNKMYRAPPFDRPPVLTKLTRALSAVSELLGANRAGSHAFLADDTLVWFRNLGFLSDPEFVRACAPHAADQVIRARLWRVYTLCWAARSCLRLPGDYIDVGCYDGKTVEIMARYVDFAGQKRRWHLYDLFDMPPEEARKAGHGPQLHAQVVQRMRGLGNFEVVRGCLPDAFDGSLPGQIAFAQIDLNVAQSEIACLEVLYDRVVPGGLLVLDDYGFMRYRETHEAQRRFFAQRGETVLELPTGQGLVLKR
jgi:O-methyltransferase